MWKHTSQNNNWIKRKMVSWEEVVNGIILMGRSRSLFLALNASRRRREEEEERKPGVNPNMGKGGCSKI